MNKLSKRLNVISNIVTGKVICDVGCDHGKLSEHLLATNTIDFAYVSDISQDSLNKAITLLKSKNLPFKAICTNGLEGYKGITNIDECIIAGMGGNEIINIIKSSPISIDSYILSPQHNIVEVKEFITSLKYEIIYDIIIKDKHKFYNIFKCKKSNHEFKYSKYQLMFGKDNFGNKDSDIVEYIDFELNKNYELLNKVDEFTKKQINEKCELLKTAKKEIENNE